MEQLGSPNVLLGLLFIAVLAWYFVASARIVKDELYANRNNGAEVHYEPANGIDLTKIPQDKGYMAKVRWIMSQDTSLQKSEAEKILLEHDLARNK